MRAAHAHTSDLNKPPGEEQEGSAGQLSLKARSGDLDADSLDELARMASLLAADLRRLSLDATRGQMHEGEIPAPCTADQKKLNGPAYDAAEALRFLAHLQEARSHFFGDTVPPDPAWEMLMELMLNALAGRKISVTSLCLASKAPVTTALRRMQDLIKAGLADRTRDESDRRRHYVELSSKGRHKMRRFLNAAAQSIEQGSAMLVRREQVGARSSSR